MNEFSHRCRAILPAILLAMHIATTHGRAGTVVAWGWNDYQQTNVPPTLTNAVAIATSGYHNLALQADGTVVAWGYNGSGETNVPAGLSGVTAVAAGYLHSLALRNNGTVVAWGDNTHGQTNVPATLSNVVAIAAGESHNLALRNDGTVIAWGDSAGTNVPAWLTDVMAIAAGSSRSLALRADGTVVAWGAASPLPAGLTNVSAISEMADHNLALLGDGSIIDWGRSISPPAIPNVVAVAAGQSALASSYFGLALRSDGTVIRWDCCSSGPLEFTNVTAIAGGDDNGLAIVEPAATGAPIIVRQPASRTAFEGSATVFSVGAIGNPPLAYQWQAHGTNMDGATNAALNLAGIQLADTGNYRVVITNSSGTATSSNAVLSISLAAPQISQQPADRTVLAGTNAAFSVTAVGALPLAYQWRVGGTNIFDATNAVLTLSNVQSTDAAGYDVVVSNAHGSVTSSNAQLSVIGLAEAVNATNLVWTSSGDAPWFPQATITHDGTAAARSGATGDNQQSTLQTSVTGPGALIFWWKVSSDPADVLSLSVNGTTQTSISGSVDWQQRTNYLGLGAQTVRWTYTKNASGTGGSDAGWLDQVSFVPGTTAAVITASPTNQTVLVRQDAAFSGAGVGTPPLNYQWQSNGVNIAGVTSPTLILTNVQFSQAGNYHLTVSNAYGGAVSADATLVVSMIAAWGVNTYGQTNVPSGLSNVIAVAAGSVHSVALRSNGTVIAWGKNGFNETNVPAGLSNVVAIAAAGFFANAYGYSLALKTNGTVTEWGDPARVVPAGLSNVVAIAAGADHALALKSDGTVFGWGSDNNGQSTGVVVPGSTNGLVAFSGQVLSNVVAIAAGDGFSLGLRSDGTVVGWGQNTSGQASGVVVPAVSFVLGATVTLGGQVLSNVVALSAGNSHSYALKENGTVVAWGSNASGQTNVPAGLSNVVAVAVGGSESTDHCLVLKSDGKVVAWGRNTSGQTNVPSLTNVVGIAAGSAHNLAVVGSAPPARLRVPMSGPAVTSGSFRVSLPAQRGKVYQLEYKQSPADNTWTMLSLAVGDGGTLTLTDLTATNSPQRFYRVREW